MTLLTFFVPSGGSTEFFDPYLQSVSSTRSLIIDDTADLLVYPYDFNETSIPTEDVSVANFRIRKPDGTFITDLGEIRDDGAVFYQFVLDQVGTYRWIVQFTFSTGEKRSYTAEITSYDPLGSIASDTLISNGVWSKIEDCFDSSDGGPWLREMTMHFFDRNKIPQFLPEALMEINVYNPITDLTENVFFHETRGDDGTVISTNPNSNTPILVLGTFLGVVRHLMRSYVEQPLPTGGQITYEDRRDYLQRWGTIYQIESQRYDSLLKLWKRQYLSLNQGKVLVSSKAGRLTPAPLRSRNIGRGYY